MKSIITPKQIKESVVKVICDEEQGTGFLISESLLLTAYHVVIDSTQIKIKFNDGSELLGELISKDENLDIAIVKLQKDCTVFLPLQSRTIRYNENWETDGYPYYGQANDLRLIGKVNQIQINDRSDFILNSDDIDIDFDYSGFSGAPVVLSDKVGGVILQQEDDKLLAISIYKIKNYLIENCIEVEEEISVLDIPHEFDDDIRSSTPNYENHEAIDNIIQSSRKWFLLTGSPGSGKTISIAAYLPESENVEILGKYFVKVPKDNTPKALKTSDRYFIQWLEKLIFLKLTGSLPPVDDNSFEKKLAKLPSLLNELGLYYQSIRKNALIIIDGLDEIPDLKTFLNVVPIALPDNIKFLLSCTSQEILPSEIKSIISQNEIVVAKPINLGQCETFIQKEISIDTVSIEKIQEIALKSEGHPLYLRYLVNYIKTLNKNELDGIDNWINQVPTIGGDISKYYDSLWYKIFEVPDRLWIVLILSWLRQPIKQVDLIDMLPEQYKLNFISHFNTLKYLLKGEEYLEIYHTSFKDYIIIKTDLFSTQANDNISKFCSSKPDHIYSINNFLYHQSQSTNYEKAISNCNQDWADKCSLKSVSPELIISDLKSIINISIDLKQTIESIRLLLLLQRIEFRYDSIFAENANLIASALISLGEFKASLNYLVRDNTLLVDNYDALLFLQLLFENEAFSEARILSEAISKRYRRLINEGISSKKGISYDTFMLQLNSLTLSMNENKEGLKKFWGLMQTLKRQQDTAQEQNNSEMYNALYTIREYAASWQSAYALRRFDLFMNSEEIAKATGLTIDKKWAKMKATALILYDEIETYSTGVSPKTKNYFLAISDLENLIEKYGYEEEKSELQILINALIDSSKKSELVKSLIFKYLEFEDNFNIRKKNGVDLNYKDIYELYFKFKFKGYLYDSKELPIVQKSYDRHKKWEDFTIAVLKNIAFLDGKSQLCKALNLKEDLESTIEEYSKVLYKIDFTFDERSFWERSYSLPEAFYPLIYSKVTWYLTQFSHKGLNIFLHSFQSKTQNQAGLYSEGFRKCLLEITCGLIKANCEKEKIKELLDIWSNFIIKNVDNRWERTSDLLKIIELYGLIAEKEKGIEIFKTMLKTSMGPSWYKEAQLELLNSTLDLTKGEDILNKYLREFASIFDYASGEMTFQRYVRVEKEVFIGNLIKSGKADIAFEYFKSEVIPSPEQIIRNAEKSTFDAPRIGDGYCLGARNIKEQSGIIEILKKIEVKSSYLKWCLSEVFTINDDVFRYVQSFGELQAQLLTFYEGNGDIHIDEFYKTIVRIASSKELEEEKFNYLNCFKGQISDVGIKTIQGYLLKNEISWDIDLTEKKLPKSSEESKDDRFEKFNCSCQNYGKASRENLIKEGTQAFVKERVNIWLNNWSTRSNIAKNNLKKLFKDEFEVFEYLKEFINDYSYDTWSVTSELIWFLESNLSLEKKEAIYKTISEHFAILIRPDEESIAKFNWIDNRTTIEDNDGLLARFLVWFLNHPNEGFSSRAFKSIEKLANYEPEFMIPVLIEEAASIVPNASPLKCSLILKNISDKNPDLIKTVLEKKNDCLKTLVTIKHFSIKKNLLDCAINLNKIGYRKLYNEIYSSIPEVIVLGGNVVLDEEYLESISYEIDEMNSLQILDRQFCESLLDSITSYCRPLSISDFQKSDKYLRRSFPNDTYYSGRFDEVLKFALNISITRRVDKGNLNEIFNILNI